MMRDSLYLGQAPKIRRICNHKWLYDHDTSVCAVSLHLRQYLPQQRALHNDCRMPYTAAVKRAAWMLPEK